MSKIPKLNVTQAGVTSLFIALIGQIVAFLPSLSSEQTALVSGGSFVIAAVFAGIHAFSDFGEVVSDARTGKVKVTLTELEDGIRTFADDEISKVKQINPADIEKIFNELLDGKLPDVKSIEQSVENKIKEILSGGLSLNVPPVVPVPVPAPVVATPEAPAAAPAEVSVAPPAA